jgi:hypothetical protein
LKDEESSHNDSKPPDYTSNRASVERGKELSPESPVASAKPPAPPSNPKDDLDADNKQKKSDAGKECCKNISVTLVETGELKKAERWAVGIGIAALVVTVLGLLVAAWTLVVFHKQLIEMQAQTEISRGIAHQAAQDSISAENRSREQLALDQRPWLGVKAVNVLPPQVGKRFPIEVITANTGKTPAINAHGETHVFVSEKPTDQLQIQGHMATSPKRSTATVFPNGEFSHMLYLEPLTEERVAAINNHSLLVYIWSDFAYDDVLGSHHKTLYCGIYNPEANLFVQCPENNHAN